MVSLGANTPHTPLTHHTLAPTLPRTHTEEQKHTHTYTHTHSHTDTHTHTQSLPCQPALVCSSSSPAKVAARVSMRALSRSVKSGRASFSAARAASHAAMASWSPSAMRWSARTADGDLSSTDDGHCQPATGRLVSRIRNSVRTSAATTRLARALSPSRRAAKEPSPSRSAHLGLDLSSFGFALGEHREEVAKAMEQAEPTNSGAVGNKSASAGRRSASVGRRSASAGRRSASRTIDWRKERVYHRSLGLQLSELASEKRELLRLDEPTLCPTEPTLCKHAGEMTDELCQLEDTMTRRHRWDSILGKHDTLKDEAMIMILQHRLEDLAVRQRAVIVEIAREASRQRMAADDWESTQLLRECVLRRTYLTLTSTSKSPDGLSCRYGAECQAPSGCSALAGRLHKQSKWREVRITQHSVHDTHTAPCSRGAYALAGTACSACLCCSVARGVSPFASVRRARGPDGRRGSKSATRSLDSGVLRPAVCVGLWRLCGCLRALGGCQAHAPRSRSRCCRLTSARLADCGARRGILERWGSSQARAQVDRCARGSLAPRC